MMPERETLNEALAYITRALEPAGAEGTVKALMPLFLTLEIPNVADMSPETKEAYFSERAAEYQRLLAHVPGDILSAACDAHVLKSKFFPAISELMEHAGPELEKRRRQGERIDRMIEAHGKPQPKPPEPSPRELETREERMRKGIASLRQYGRLATAKQWEHDLAKLEGREVEAWALEPIAAPPPPPETTIKREPEAQHMVSAARAAQQALKAAGFPLRSSRPGELTADEIDQRGAIEGAARLDEPPLPDEIPE